MKSATLHEGKISLILSALAFMIASACGSPHRQSGSPEALSTVAEDTIPAIDANRQARQNLRHLTRLYPGLFTYRLQDKIGVDDYLNACLQDFASKFSLTGSYQNNDQLFAKLQEAADGSRYPEDNLFAKFNLMQLTKKYPALFQYQLDYQLGSNEALSKSLTDFISKTNLAEEKQITSELFEIIRQTAAGVRPLPPVVLARANLMEVTRLYPQVFRFIPDTLTSDEAMTSALTDFADKFKLDYTTTEQLYPFLQDGADGKIRPVGGKWEFETGLNAMGIDPNGFFMINNQKYTYLDLLAERPALTLGTNNHKVTLLINIFDALGAKTKASESDTFYNLRLESARQTLATLRGITDTGSMDPLAWAQLDALIRNFSYKSDPEIKLFRYRFQRVYLQRFATNYGRVKKAAKGFTTIKPHVVSPYITYVQTCFQVLSKGINPPYVTGDSDGIWAVGNEANKALLRFQLENELPMTGQLDRTTLAVIDDSARKIDRNLAPAPSEVSDELEIETILLDHPEEPSLLAGLRGSNRPRQFVIAVTTGCSAVDENTDTVGYAIDHQRNIMEFRLKQTLTLAASCRGGRQVSITNAEGVSDLKATGYEPGGTLPTSFAWIGNGITIDLDSQKPEVYGDLSWTAISPISETGKAQLILLKIEKALSQVELVLPVSLKRQLNQFLAGQLLITDHYGDF